MHEENRLTKRTVRATLRGEHLEAIWSIEDRVDVEVFKLTIHCRGFTGHAFDDGNPGALQAFKLELEDFLARKRPSVEFREFFGTIQLHFERTTLGAISLAFQLRNGSLELEGNADLDDGHLRDFLQELLQGWQVNA